MRDHPLTWLDVFTSRPLRGNQLAVVHDADDLDKATMLAFARETRQSETTFVQSASTAGADYRNRIFMVRHEVPFAGHPSLGTAVAVAFARGETDASYVQQTGAGLQPIDVRLTGERTAHASMLQEPVTFGQELDRATVLDAAGIDRAYAHPDMPPQVVATGVPQILVPVKREGLRELHPDFDACRSLIDQHAALTIYLWAQEGDRVRARALLVDQAAMGEDPATGSAVGPVMAYLHERQGVERITVQQGVEMGRESLLECSVEEDRVRVGGDAVVLATGNVRL